jgi:hypothetical protein
LNFALFAGIPAEALILKGWRPIEPRYQQSYPQENWIVSKALANQRLRLLCSNFL